jgi:hypothetical protein
MRELSHSPDDEFEAYLANGDTTLIRSTMRPGRVGFTESGVRYVGTIWNGVYWPEWLTGVKSPSAGGFFFWGRRKGIVETIRPGRLAELIHLEIKPKVISEARLLIVTLKDGTCLIWAANESENSLALR